MTSVSYQLNYRVGFIVQIIRANTKPIQAGLALHPIDRPHPQNPSNFLFPTHPALIRFDKSGGLEPKSSRMHSHSEPGRTPPKMSESRVPRREFCRLLGGFVAGVAAAAPLLAEETHEGVLYPVRAPLPKNTAAFSWYEEVLRRIPPLKHPRGNRWPLIAWEGFSFQPQKPEYYHELLRRGLTQHIRLDAGMIDTALALQRAGSPVIAMEGGGGPFPASLAGEPAVWAHQLDAGYKPADYVRPCPSLHAGWAKFADQLRGILARFREHGVRIDAVWADWEGDPLYGGDRYQQARHCHRCRSILPAKVMESDEAFNQYTARKFYELFGSYYAAPILEYFPACSVTDWLAQPSTPEEPQIGWSGEPGHVFIPPLVTAYNPTAYGAASWVWKSHPTGAKRDQEHVDQVYTNLLLRHVSLAGSLAERWTPEKELIPWVARWVSEAPETSFPVMSRPRYREVLRHLWLRGVAGMQVFSPRMKDFEDMALPEIEDAAAVYDEMLGFREFLEHGTVLNHAIPAVQDEKVVWSGLRFGDRAVVRVFKQGGGKAQTQLSPWDGKRFDLEADPNGTTYILRRDGQAEKTSGG